MIPLKFRILHHNLKKKIQWITLVNTETLMSNYHEFSGPQNTKIHKNKTIWWFDTSGLHHFLRSTLFSKHFTIHFNNQNYEYIHQDIEWWFLLFHHKKSLLSIVKYVSLVDLFSACSDCGQQLTWRQLTQYEYVYFEDQSATSRGWGELCWPL